ncbi:Hsp70 family protein [Isoptericola sp. b515]|uniref:Hsp70 family protein n=1 Tax=Isoptericola sp. b515 TaxID=3064652 RepID=UPI00271303C7|nr:Hsp70 family protein [Isoptericola sp. b515]MDO8147507.1 Hsp70 family protein [Isoptericola sp. b515]
MTSVGIDFGTTNSVVAHFAAGSPAVLSSDEPPADWAGLGFDRVLPTVFGRGLDDRPIFGWQAKQRPGSLAAVKRLLRAEERAEVDGIEYSVEEIATLIFGHLKRSGAAQGVGFDQAVVTIPANSRGIARYRTKLAAGMAGVQVQALINEPTAAAMSYSMRSATEETLMVVDWGGGTLDVTILRNVEGVFMEQASKGIQKLGGLDFDSALARLVLDTVSDSDRWTQDERTGFRLDVERAKIQLSELEEVSVPLPGGQYRRITRPMYEQVIQSQVHRVREPIEQCLKDLGGSASDIDALVLVGGTCKTPLIRRFVADAVGLSPAPGIDPMTAVAEGAAVASAILGGDLDDRDFFVSTEHALGTKVLNPNVGLVFSELIPRNHKLPARATETFTPVRDFQDQLQVEVVEGDPEKPLDDDDNVVLKEWTITLPEPRAFGEISIDLTYSYDVDGILHVHGEDSLGNVVLDEAVSYGASVDKRELTRIAQRVSRTLDEDRIAGPPGPSASSLSAADRQLVNDVQAKILPFIDDAEATQLRSAVTRLEGGDASAAAELQAATRQYSYLL